MELFAAAAGPDRRRYRARLLRWYATNARDLPWRRARDPYRIWVSEIMLQQTRVAAVVGHYREFLRRFPTLAALARAREDQVLAAWSGLGYYRRARLLHQAARVVRTEHGGKLPRDVAALRRLPGVGRYTAAAIASIAFEVPAAVVDGNVERVLSRLAGKQLSQGEAWQRAEQLVEPRRPGDFNQALMELGATVCLPEKPECARCPVRAWCATQGALPARASAARRKQATAYLLAQRNGAVRLVQRNARERLMPGMWELPPARPSGARPLLRLRLRHSITTTDYAVSVFSGTLSGTSSGTSSGTTASGKWVPRNRLAQLPLTGLARKILRRAGVLANPT
jgi:A/G-specific adenine glycosylase